MVIFEGEDHLMGKECDGQTVFITSAKKLRIRALDLGDPGLTPGLAHHYFSHPVTYGSLLSADFKRY